MKALLGRSHVLKPLLRLQFLRKNFMKYAYTGYKNILPDYEIDECLLISKENRERCLTEMSCAPPLGVPLKGAKSERKYAAILIALCTDEKDQNLCLLYTRRSHLLSRHMRQISFPGGIKEENENFVQCALRETEEEIGLHPSRCEIWGSGKLITPPHTAAIMPVIGLIKNFKISELKLNAVEVEEAFAIPIKRLTNPQTLHYTQFRSGYAAPVFVVDDKRIWGITGSITNMFLNCFLPPELNKLKNRVKFIRPFKSKSSS